MHEYSHADLKRLFGLSAALLKSLSNAGYIGPVARTGKHPYTFEELLVIRTAGALNDAKIAPAKILDALRRLKSTLPPGSPLTRLALGAFGKEVIVREGAGSWEVRTGQYALPIPANTKADAAAPARKRKLPGAPQNTTAEADAHYARGHALEESDVDAAREAYIRALRAHRDHLDARVNLGRLLHMAGDLHAAEKVYRQARSSSALLSFNLATLLEDLNREDEAVESYREALAQDPSLHDAHFNLAQLHERADRPQEALRHLLAYRRHLARQQD